MEEPLIFCDLIDRYHYKQLTHDQLVIFLYMLRKCLKLKEEFVFYKILKGTLDPEMRKLRDMLEESYLLFIRNENK